MFTDAKKPRSQQGLLSQQNTIAQETTFEGDLKSEGDFRIEGAIIGTLTTKGKVVIGSTGKINGSLSCKNADKFFENYLQKQYFTCFNKSR